MNNLPTAIQEFLRHCKYEKNLSPKTISAYQIDLSQLCAFLTTKKYSEELTQITKVVLREYLETIATLKPKSIKRKVATIKAMFNYLEFEDQIEINPLRKMRIKIREPKKLPVVMTINEVNEIFKSAHTISRDKRIGTYSYLESMRDIVVVELLFATGARVSEISNLSAENISVISGAVTINGKGNKERIIEICNEETLNLLRQYYAIFEDRIKKSGGYFLINRLGKRLSDQSIRNTIKRLCRRAELQKHITPHIFRHTLATLLLEKDVDIKYIQSLLGHSSILTTQIYTHVTREKQRQILNTKHPRKDLSIVP